MLGRICEEELEEYYQNIEDIISRNFIQLYE